MNDIARPVQMLRSVSAAEIDARLGKADEMALVDVREEGEFGMGHMLLAVNVPYSLLELQMPAMVPRRTCPLILMDQGDGRIARSAAARLGQLGYTDIAVLEGGVAAWKAAGHVLFEGIYVPSKAFGEWVEHHFATPCIGPEELAAMMAQGKDVQILDPRTVAEHAANHVPGAASCPSAELSYRFDDLVPSPETLVVVACGGRTRGIVGAQSLINAGVPNRVVALADGNHGWKLAGLTLESGLHRGYGAVSSTARENAGERTEAMRQAYHLPDVDEATVRQWQADAGRTTVLLDVRTAEEYEAGHFESALHAPGGQLVQATDKWLGTYGARVVLIDTDGARAAAIATWLRCMHWDAYTMVFTAAKAVGVADSAEASLRSSGKKSADEAARVAIRATMLESALLEHVARISIHGAQQAMRDEETIAVCFDRSGDFLASHPPGAIWANRARLDRVNELLRKGRSLLLFSEDGKAAELAALDLREVADRPDEQVRVVEGGLRAWRAAGMLTYASDECELPQEQRLDTLYWLHDRRHGNKDAMRSYLGWEKGLLGQLEQDGFAFKEPVRVLA